MAFHAKSSSWQQAVFVITHVLWNAWVDRRVVVVKLIIQSIISVSDSQKQILGESPPNVGHRSVWMWKLRIIHPCCTHGSPQFCGHNRTLWCSNSCDGFGDAGLRFCAEALQVPQLGTVSWWHCCCSSLGRSWAGAASCGWSSGLSLVVVLLEADVGLCVRLWFLTCESRVVTQLFSVSGIRQGLQKSRTAEICREGYQRFRASLACFYKCCLNMGRKESYWCLLSK